MSGQILQNDYLRLEVSPSTGGAVVGFDQKELRKLLIQLVPGFKPQSEITDILYKEV